MDGSGENRYPHPMNETALLDEIVRRIRSVVQPTRIVLFGSRARGEARPDSDIDLLVEVPDGHHRSNAEADIYERLVGVPAGVDVVVVTTSDIERYGDAPGLVLATALHEGRVLHAA